MSSQGYSLKGSSDLYYGNSKATWLKGRIWYTATYTYAFTCIYIFLFVRVNYFLLVTAYPPPQKKKKSCKRIMKKYLLKVYSLSKYEFNLWNQYVYKNIFFLTVDEVWQQFKSHSDFRFLTSELSRYKRMFTTTVNITFAKSKQCI